MNNTVARIVDLLFARVVMTEETQAMRDEVLNNCQERYASLVADGYAEDVAIAAVVESLKGMEDVLRDYPQKEDEPAGDDAFRKASPGDVISWEKIRHLRVNVRTADIEVFEADAHTLEVKQGADSGLDVRVEGDTLVVIQGKRPASRSGKYTIQDDQVEGGGFLSALSRLVRSAVVVSLDPSCSLRLGLPAGMLRSARVQTLSGDIDFSLPAPEVTLQSTSGEISVKMAAPEGFSASPLPSCGRLAAVSVSGDVEAEGDFGTVELNTTSGDIDFAGAAARLSVSTVSGDIDAKTGGGPVTAQSVSGDVELSLGQDGPASLTISTVSGDVDISLAEPALGVRGDIRTRSGDVTWRNSAHQAADAPVQVTLSSMSGDIDIG